jgi:hypothetical protein
MSGSRRWLLLAAAVAAAVLIVVALTSRGGPRAPVSPVDGVVIAVDARGLTDVRSFTLRTGAGEQLTFTLERLENPVEFPPGHLTVHLADGAPVRVTFVVDGDALAATRLEDAPAG